jgi:hypothetical protein
MKDSFISGLIVGKTIDATIHENYNHYYLEQEVLFNHNHDGYNSSNLVSGVNIGLLTVDKLVSSEYMKLTDIAEYWESEWVLLTAGQSKKIYHNLNAIPSIIQLYHTQNTTSISGCQSQNDCFFTNYCPDRRFYMTAVASNITAEDLTLILGGFRYTTNNQVTNEGTNNGLTTGNGYIKVILYR